MRISRLISIILILLDKKRVNAKDLANMLEVSMRTIYRDIDTINLAGIPIVSTSGVNGGFEIMGNYKLNQTTFSVTELSTILTGLSSVSNVVENDELINTMVKIKSLIPENRLDEITFKTEQISVDLSQWVGYRNLQPYLEIIKTGLQENTLLSFDYLDQHGNLTERKVEPYQVLLKANQWYFQGYCNKRDDFRLFKLSRISNLKLETTNFTTRDFDKPILDFSDSFRTQQVIIKLRVHRSILDSILDFCAQEDCVPDGDEHYIVSYPFIENDYYYNLLLGFGDKCECIEPQHVRKNVQQKIQNLANLYKK